MAQTRLTKQVSRDYDGRFVYAFAKNPIGEKIKSINLNKNLILHFFVTNGTSHSWEDLMRL